MTSKRSRLGVCGAGRWSVTVFAAGAVAVLAAASWNVAVRAGGRADPRIVTPRRTATTMPTLGDPKAPVTLMVFGDFQCPYSALQIGVLRQLVKDLPSKVKVVWRDFPLAFHQQARPAAVAGQEVFLQKGNKAFWAFHELVFANSRNITDSALVTWAGQVGASPEKVRAALGQQAGRPQKAVDLDIQEGKAVGVRGTPATFIFKLGTPLPRAKQLSGSRQYPAMRAEVDAL